ncbi:MAG: glutamate synthase-related protein, partial [Desulfovibrionales bacterium]
MVDVLSRTGLERDGCAIIALVDKRGRSTHANITRAIEALRDMGHRSGGIEGEGDGCGIQIDIPWESWARWLSQNGMNPLLAESRSFFVGHFLLRPEAFPRQKEISRKLRELFAARDMEIMLERIGQSKNRELGPRGRENPHLFWQIGGMVRGGSPDTRSEILFRAQLELEREFPELHVTSIGQDSVVYKLRGSPEMLPRVFPELLREETRSVATLGHSRYSTNTLPGVELAQPFSVLTHNGEINTIERLRSVARTLTIPLCPEGSDSQDLNRIMEGLIHLFGFDLLEVLEMVFPPVRSESIHYPRPLSEIYDFYRWFFPPSAQGPAALVTRRQGMCLGSVDAMGLRPLWFGETDYDYFFSSEKGVMDIRRIQTDPKHLGPGEKIGLAFGTGRPTSVLLHEDIQARLVSFFQNRQEALDCSRRLFREIPSMEKDQPWFLPSFAHLDDDALLSRVPAGYGWHKYDMDMRRKVAETGRPPINSMGYTGPLAPLAPDSLPLISEFFKEEVAVVTNPAIDREREAEHFSTTVILGDRPDADFRKSPPALGLEVPSPLLLSCTGLAGLIDDRTVRSIASGYASAVLEDILWFFTAENRELERVAVIDTSLPLHHSLESGLARLTDKSCRAVTQGAVLLVLDDSRSIVEERIFIDPGLVLPGVDQALAGSGLRRETSIVVRSGAVRNLHDIMFLVGLGADALDPFLLWRVCCLSGNFSPESSLSNTLRALHSGIEQVMSTMGIHELCGYGRLFSSIGLSPKLEQLFNCPNFCSSEKGIGFSDLEGWAVRRRQPARSNTPTLWKDPSRNTRVGKILRKAALGETSVQEMSSALCRLERDHPTAVRHLLSFVQIPDPKRLAPDQVDISVKEHSLPLVISAMSFGSQGENSFRTYAEAGLKANTICINGEGGEIPDMLGRYRKNRAQQIASGRFGVDMALINSADLLEIKIGQGAKPGEGGHLPGSKVTEMVARARHCKPGITLISPSNQHDIYSIEDLHQIISELKIANPAAEISVKIPVTSGIGTISVAIAKAGADIVNISGFEGGTGAAREHARKYVGLPVEIGVAYSHRALISAGLRNKVEIWCDGGIRSGRDALKMILLGADRVGIGTAALMAIGCISCARCHLDRCPRGISTQIATAAEAAAQGIKGYKPRDIERESDNLARLLNVMGDEMRRLLARLGRKRITDVVGRVDLLRQTKGQERLDASELLAPIPQAPAYGLGALPLRKPLDHLTRIVSDLIMSRFLKGHLKLDYTDEHV